MDGVPGGGEGVEGVGGGGAGVAEGVEVVDEGEAAVLEGELRDGEDVLRLVEVVLAEAVGEGLGAGVADPGLVDVGDDLVAGGGLAEAGGVGLVAGGLLVALIAIEEAQGDVDGEAGGVVGAGTVVLAFEGGVGGSVGDGEAGVGFGGSDGGLGGGEVGTFGEGLLDEASAGSGDDGRDDLADDVEVFDRGFDADERLKLVTGLEKCDLVVGGVRLEASELEVEAFVVELAEVSGLVAVEADLDFVAVVLEAGVGELEGFLGDRASW